MPLSSRAQFGESVEPGCPAMIETGNVLFGSVVVVLGVVVVVVVVVVSWAMVVVVGVTNGWPTFFATGTVVVVVVVVGAGVWVRVTLAEQPASGAGAQFVSVDLAGGTTVAVLVTFPVVPVTTVPVTV
jgi:hypothetical protein